MPRLTRLLLLLALTATACTSGGAEARPPAPSPPLPSPSGTPTAALGGTLRWAIQEPDAIVPPAAVEPAGLLVVDAVFDSLTDYDGALRVVPSAAIDWEANDTGDLWTFHLRRDARFHDGTPVTAADFVFAWEQAVRLDRSGYHLRDVAGYAELRAGTADGLAGVQSIDQHTLEVRLSAPRADFPAIVAHPALGPVQQAAWQSDATGYRQQPIGNGPFALAEQWARGQFIRVTRADTGVLRNDGQVDEVLFRITDPDAGYVAFQQERVDVTVVPPGALEQALDAYGRAVAGSGGVLLEPAPALYYLGVAVTRPPFDEVEVRRALSLAIDRQRIVDEVLEGNADVARAAVPIALPGHRPLACGRCHHAPEVAERLFAAHEVTDVTLWLNSDGGHEQIARRVRDDLATAGVRVALRRLPFPEFLDALADGDPALFRFGWTAEYASLDDALWPLFHSQALPPVAGVNYGGYADPEVDALLAQARATLDQDDRRALYQRAEALALGRDQAIVPLFTYRQRVVVGERVRGFRLDPFGRANLEAVRLQG